MRFLVASVFALPLLLAGCAAQATDEDQAPNVDVELDSVTTKGVIPSYCLTAPPSATVSYAENTQANIAGIAPAFSRCLYHILEITNVTGHGYTIWPRNQLPQGVVVLPSHCQNSGGRMYIAGFIPAHWDQGMYIPAAWHELHDRTAIGVWGTSSCQIIVPGPLENAIHQRLSLSPYTKLRVITRHHYIDANYDKQNIPTLTTVTFHP